jgi:hypothetical protein
MRSPTSDLDIRIDDPPREGRFPLSICLAYRHQDRSMPSVRALLVLAVLLAPRLPAAAQSRVPAFHEVTGHRFGERITLHHQMQTYLERLAATSPRVQVIRQGESWEHRALLLAVVTSPENHARLEAIRANSLRLADPRRTDPAEAQAILADQPVIVWYGGSIHGFELSGTEGVLKLLEHLTTRDDPATLEVLRNTVVLIDPMLNPDGRDAFAHINHEHNGREPNPAPQDWANDFTGWQALKYRTGHYYFDTNRDWFAHTQRETRDRMPTLHAWRPQTATDMHEMGADSEFFFDPPGDPTNPHLPRFTLRWFQEFGNAYAAAFDSAGFEYMTRERYNYFYPGYTSNRGYQGAVAMLFEQGSTRGLALERSEGPVRTLAQALEQQYVAAWTGVRTASANRETLLREYYASQREAVQPTGGPRRYFIPDDGSGNVRELIRLLRRNDVEVGVLGADLRSAAARDRSGGGAGARTFAAGTFVVETGQPSGRLIRALLDPEVPIAKEFLETARRFVDRNENPRFYDITAWSLPLLFHVQAFASDEPRAPAVRPLDENADLAAGPVPDGRGAYAYILPGHQPASVAALYHLKAAGHRAAVITRGTRVGGLDVPHGSVIVRIGQNDSTVHERVRGLAARYALDVAVARTGLSDSALPALGSGDWTFNARVPAIALLAEDPIQGYSFGWTWYTLDRQFEIPTTVLRVRSVATTPLDRFNVLIIPETQAGALATALGRPGVERIRRWVQDGGTLVTIGGATDFARDSSALGLIALRSWYDLEEGRRATRYAVPGAIFQAELDPGYWLRAGYAGNELPVLVNSNRLYRAPDGPPNQMRRVVARVATGDALISGHAWDESRRRLPGSVLVYEERVGRGRVIAFAEEPNFRAYQRGLNRLFLNAVVLGPGAP